MVLQSRLAISHVLWHLVRARRRRTIATRRRKFSLLGPRFEEAMRNLGMGSAKLGTLYRGTFGSHPWYAHSFGGHNTLPLHSYIRSRFVYWGFEQLTR